MMPIKCSPYHGKEAEQGQEPSIKMGNINSARFNSNHFAILAKVETSSNKVTIKWPYKKPNAIPYIQKFIP